MFLNLNTIKILNNHELYNIADNIIPPFPNWNFAYQVLDCTEGIS